MPKRAINMVLYTTTNSTTNKNVVFKPLPSLLNGSMIANANAGKSGCSACGH